MFDHRGLEVFLAVVDRGTTTAAAEHLFVSQPAVSRQLTKLERQVGALLFHRLPTGMRLTPVGERLEGLARDLVRRDEQAARAMAEVRGDSLLLTVVCPPTTGQTFVAPFIAEGGRIADMWPSAPADIWEELRLHGDFGINTRAPPPRLRPLTLLSTVVHAYLPPGDPRGAVEQIELTDVLAAPFLLPGFGSAVTRVVGDAAERSGLSIALGVQTSTATIALARAAAGEAPALAIETPLFGLRPTRLAHHGRELVVTLYAGWDPHHPMADTIATVVGDFKGFMLRCEAQMWTASAAGP